MLESRIGDAARTVLRPMRSTVTSRCCDSCCTPAVTALANSTIAAEPSPARSGTAISAWRSATRPYAVRL